MQVIFLHHSSFLVEVDDKVLIFDYFDGERVGGYHFSGRIPTYAPDTKIYMFASHSHQDHFDMDILKWDRQYPNIRYVFSKDIKISPNFLRKHDIDPKIRERILFVGADQKYELDGLSITTFRSTDAGVAFYVDVQGVSLFHAGDLNDWTWQGVGDLINGKMTREYRHQIHRLSKLPVNLAFVPMDPRLGENQFRGIDFLLRNTDAEFVFPMHMWQNYSGIAEYKRRISNLGMADRIMDIERENQVFPFGEK
jgi:L-ascorbate metabolism protein UlaG (beta-lactamase superfamily)